MFSQLLCGREGLMTGRTHVIFLAGMRFHMGVEVASVYESLITKVTDVRSFAGVNSYVMY